MELGKPELPEFYSPGRVFLSAFAIGAAAAAKKTQLEAQLQHLQLQNEAMQYREQQQEASFGLRQQAMDNLNTYRLNELQIARDKADRIADAAKTDQKAQAIEDDRLIGLTQKIAQIRSDTKAGSPEQDAAFNNAQLEYSDVWNLPAAKRVWGSAIAKHADATSQAIQIRTKLQNQLRTGIKNDLGVSDPTPILRSFDNPESVVEYPNDPKRIGVLRGQRVIETTDPKTNQKTQTFEPVYDPVDKSKWKAWKATRDSLYQDQPVPESASGPMNPTTPRVQSKYSVGDSVTLKNGQTVTVKSVSPDGKTFSY